MKNSHIIFLCLFALHLSLKSSQAQLENAYEQQNKFYAVVDELKCGEATAVSVTSRERGTELVPFLDQTIYIQLKSKISVLVRGSSDWNFLNDHGKFDINYLGKRDAAGPLAAFWNCISGNAENEYIVISYWSGNCSTCG